MCRMGVFLIIEKNFTLKVENMEQEELIDKMFNTEVFSLDFEVFLGKLELVGDDFIFLDPPYDSEFSTYSQNEFTKDDQKRLAELLEKTPAKFMLVIKSTDYILSLYRSDKFNIKVFNKKYLVNFQNRNNRDVEHLIITNYEI
jgi:DNA adenine methylase